MLRQGARQVSGTLSGGEQQMLAIGRALMTGPKLLCIDELSTGLSPLLTRVLFARIDEIKGNSLSGRRDDETGERRSVPRQGKG
ncbi:MAG: ATP-binding cassette domain-containing protein [Bacillota bacterium]